MSNLPILSIFKDDPEDTPAVLFSEYKKIQNLKKLANLEKAKIDKASTKFNSIQEDLTKKAEHVDRMLSEKIQVTAADFRSFIHDNFHKLKDVEFSVDDFDRLFFKYVSSVKQHVAEDGFMKVMAEVDDTNHLIVCGDKENCDKHKHTVGMGVVRIDMREMSDG